MECPTDRITILEPRVPRIDVYQLHKICQTTYFLDLKLGNAPPGRAVKTCFHLIGAVAVAHTIRLDKRRRRVMHFWAVKEECLDLASQNNARQLFLSWQGIFLKVCRAFEAMGTAFYLLRKRWNYKYNPSITKHSTNIQGTQAAILLVN